MSTTAGPADLAPTTDDEPVLLDWLRTMCALSRCRDNAHYPDLRIMPTSA